MMVRPQQYDVAKPEPDLVGEITFSQSGTRGMGGYSHTWAISVCAAG